MKGKYTSLYLNDKRSRFIETFTDGLSNYVNKKIDEDIEKFDPMYCDTQITFWKNQKKLANKKRR